MGPLDKQHSPNLDSLVRAEKIQLLFRQSFPATFVSLVTSALLTTILWDVQDHELLISWFSILTLSSILRLILFMSYRRKTLPLENVLAWEKPYILTLVLSALIWGVGGLIILPPESEFHQVVILYFLIGMSGGAISVYSAHRAMTLLTVACILLPTTVWMFMQGSFATTAMAICTLIFYLSLVRATKILSSAMHQNFLMNYKLKEANDYAEKLARMDQLTGLFNRRAFYEQAEILGNYIERHQEVLSVIIMDIDHFKTVNDTMGHAAGDKALSHVGKLLQHMTRKSDICARIGGEEFGMLMLSTTAEDACALAEKLRYEIESTPVSFNKERFGLTSSFGVASGTNDIQDLIKRADTAMYRAKQAGRNKVTCNG